MSSQEYIRFLTQRFVEYLDDPKNAGRTKEREAWGSHWFGMIPSSLKLLFRK